MGFASLYPSYLCCGHSSQNSHRFIGPVSKYEKMIVVEGRHRIHADAGFGQAGRDRSQEAHRIERGVYRQGDQARGECVA